MIGNPEYMAPEMFEDLYDTRVDIYAFGISLLEIIAAETPYRECINPAQIFLRVHQGILPLALNKIQDEKVKEFITLCLAEK